jgi:hypothetical protein
LIKSVIIIKDKKYEYLEEIEKAYIFISELRELVYNYENAIDNFALDVEQLDSEILDLQIDAYTLSNKEIQKRKDELFNRIQQSSDKMDAAIKTTIEEITDLESPQYYKQGKEEVLNLIILSSVSNGEEITIEQINALLDKIPLELHFFGNDYY